MKVMNKKALHTLEYDKIIEMLASQADSEPGRVLCRELEPMGDLPEIKEALRKTGDAIARIFRNGETSFGSNRDLKNQIRSMKVERAMNAGELLGIAGFLENVNRVKSYGRAAEDQKDSLTDYFETLEPLTQLSSEIRRCIISETEISDDASPELSHIRRGIRLAGDRIHDKLAQMVNSSYRNYLQDTVVTMRDDRYCLPVKSEYKSQVGGIVHDQSSTGSTLFIEPTAIVELNNKLREFALQEKQEIEKILEDLSLQAGEHVLSIEEDAQQMTFLDFTFAKAKLALMQNAQIPVFNDKRKIDLKKARHPLIDKNKVVPLDVMLGENYSMLIITGPNTGGKTVTLKTVGLMCLMGQAGLAIPAGDRSELALFNEIYADIGDEQSIEQNLSTFSSHMTNTVSILEHADEHALCLFDELGAGTDPTEGAALAISILNDLHERQITTMVTTHYSEIKVYAMSTPGVQNASCEFDVESLRPTYRLLIGIPGKSNAFAISQRLGLPMRIIDAAKTQIGQEDKKFEDLLADLDRSRRTIEAEELEAKRLREEVAELKKELETQSDKIKASKEKILREAQEEAKEILQDAKSLADDTIRTFKKAGHDANIQDLDRARTKVSQKISEKNSKLSAANANKDITHPILKENQIRIGESVRIVSMGLKGTISTKPDKDGNLFVTCGIMKTKTNIRDLVIIKDEDDRKNKYGSYGKSGGSGSGGRSGSSGWGSGSGDYKMDLSRSSQIKTEIQLIGMNSDDAISKLDKYLDEAYMSHLPSVRVVHGKGSGILRQAVHRYLKNIPYVKSYKLGEFGEGDSGVTIVTFR